MKQDDGYDAIRDAYIAGSAAAFMYAFEAMQGGDAKKNAKAPDVEEYINLLKAMPLHARFSHG